MPGLGDEAGRVTASARVVGRHGGYAARVGGPVVTSVGGVGRGLGRCAGGSRRQGERLEDLEEGEERRERGRARAERTASGTLEQSPANSPRCSLAAPTAAKARTLVRETRDGGTTSSFDASRWRVKKTRGKKAADGAPTRNDVAHKDTARAVSRHPAVSSA